MVGLSGVAQAGQKLISGSLLNDNGSECDVLNHGEERVTANIYIYDSNGSLCEPFDNSANCTEADDNDFVTCTISPGQVGWLRCDDEDVRSYCELTTRQDDTGVSGTFISYNEDGEDTTQAVLELHRE